jgi:DNA-binding response OmpR family regulator
MDRIHKRILLVDDEVAILFGFQQVLSEPHIQVDTASNADDAKAQIMDNVYDAIIVDIRLSNSTAMEGLDLIPLIRKIQKKCYIIVLTAFGDESLKRRALGLGADLYLEKAIPPELIKENLASAGIS